MNDVYEFKELSEDFYNYLVYSESDFEKMVDMPVYTASSKIMWELLLKSCVEEGVSFIFDPRDEDGVVDVLLPFEFINLRNAREFWFKYTDNSYPIEGLPLAYFNSTLGAIKYIWSTEGVYIIKKKLFRKNEVIKVPWKEVQLSVEVDTIYVKIMMNQQHTLLKLFPDYEAVIGIDMTKLPDEDAKELCDKLKFQLEPIISQFPEKLLTYLKNNHI